MATNITAKEITLKLNKMKTKEENKKCFDCGEKGTTYVCLNFGTFICSRCAGILRELNFKVKGIGVTIFNQKEIEMLESNGNEVAKKIWLAKYKKGKDISPSLTDDDAQKDFLKDKYEEKKWYKKHKKNKKKDEDDEEKKEKKKKKKEESDNDESDKNDSDNESDSEEEKKKKKRKRKKRMRTILMKIKKKKKVLHLHLLLMMMMKKRMIRIKIKQGKKKKKQKKKENQNCPNFK